MTNEILSLKENLTKHAFQICIFLLIATFITWLPLLDLKPLVSSSELYNYDIINWFSLNETKIISWYTIYCCIETVTFFLTFISGIFNSNYFFKTRDMFSWLATIGLWFSLLLQIAYNLDITNKSISAMYDYFINLPSPLLQLFSLISYSFNWYIAGLFIIGFVYSKPINITQKDIQLIQQYHSLHYDDRKIVKRIITLLIKNKNS